jgi:hypothetical protein
MGVLETGIIYGLLGVAVAAALVLRDGAGGLGGRVGLFLAGLLFWPLFAPVLLSGGQRPEPRRTGFHARVRGAEALLLAALERAREASELAAPEVARVRGLTGAVASMEKRVEEMDALLEGPEFDEAAARNALMELSRRGVPEEDPRTRSVQARLRNVERLRAMRQRTLEDLERIVLKVEEMSSRLQLLRFAGQPDAEVVRLFKEIADGVEELTEGILAAG